jgi:hypothetical protein
MESEDKQSLVNKLQQRLPMGGYKVADDVERDNNGRVTGVWSCGEYWSIASFDPEIIQRDGTAFFMPEVEE